MLLLYTPVDRQGAIIANFPCRASFPQPTTVSASTLFFSRLHRAFTCVTACIVAESHTSDPLHRRPRRIRYLLRRFDCYWASDYSQAGLAPAETYKHSRRTVEPEQEAGKGRVRLRLLAVCIIVGEQGAGAVKRCDAKKTVRARGYSGKRCPHSIQQITDVFNTCNEKAVQNVAKAFAGRDLRRRVMFENTCAELLGRDAPSP